MRHELARLLRRLADWLDPPAYEPPPEVAQFGPGPFRAVHSVCEWRSHEGPALDPDEDRVFYTTGRGGYL